MSQFMLQGGECVGWADSSLEIRLRGFGYIGQARVQINEVNTAWMGHANVCVPLPA